MASPSRRSSNSERHTGRLVQVILITSKKIEVLEYQVNIAFDPRDKIYVARVPELDNCHTHGATPEEALKNAKEAIEL